MNILNSFVDKKLTSEIFKINNDLRFNGIEHLFNLSKSVIESLKSSQLVLSNDNESKYFDPSLLTRVRSLFNLLSSACRNSKQWLDNYQSKFTLGIDLTDEIEPQNLRRLSSETLELTIKSPSTVKEQHIDYIIPDNKNHNLSNDIIVENDDIIESEDIVRQGESEPLNVYRRSRITKQNPSEAEEIMLFDLYLQQDEPMKKKISHPINLNEL